MRKSILLAVGCASLSLGACATDRYGYYDDNDGLGRAAAGVALGAAAGAGVGAVVEGVSPTEGAIVGGIAGGAIAAATDNDRRWYRDERGYCFYVDRYNQRIYDYDRRDC